MRSRPTIASPSRGLMRVLNNQVFGAEATFNYQSSRLERQELRLSNLVRMVENCTIRAPHDGFLIYANQDSRDIRIEPGLDRPHAAEALYLPDLSQMEVSTLVHESVVKYVENGQRPSPG